MRKKMNLIIREEKYIERNHVFKMP